MDGDVAFRDLVREAVQKDKLPGRAPDRTWGGPGSGAACAICEQRLNPEDVELELEYAPRDGREQPASHRVHVRCYRAWAAERCSIEAEGATLTRTSLSDAVGEIRCGGDEREASVERCGT